MGEVSLAANAYGKGRGVYIAGLPYNAQNARILYRAMFWSASKEKEMYKAFSSDPDTECSYYPEFGRYVIVNNVQTERKTIFYDINGATKEIFLKGGECRIIE